MTVFNTVLRDARVLKEAASLQGAGYDVRILGVADDPGDDGRKTMLASGVQLVRLFPRTPFDRAREAAPGGKLIEWPIVRAQVHWRMHAWNKRVLKYLAALQPDVVHCHDLTAIKVGAVHKRRFPACRFIYDSHELTEHQEPFPWWHRAHLLGRQKRSGKCADAYITVNNRLAAYSRKHHPYFPPAVVVMNATLPKDSPFRDDGRLRRAAGLPPTAKVLLFQGGFVPGRGLPTVLSAATLLPEDWYLVLMGWGPLEARLRSLREGLPRGPEKIRFIPAASQEELPHWTAGATVGTILYENTCLNHWYCSPNKLWEYPNAGVPILASRFPEMASIISGNETGWLLDMPATAEQIAATVAAITNDDLAVKTRNCAEFVARDNWTRYEARLLDLYQSLLCGRLERAA